MGDHNGTAHQQEDHRGGWRLAGAGRDHRRDRPDRPLDGRLGRPLGPDHCSNAGQNLRDPLTGKALFVADGKPFVGDPCSSAADCFSAFAVRRAASLAAWFRCGAITMTMFRPSCLGLDSTTPSSWTSAASRCSRR